MDAAEQLGTREDRRVIGVTKRVHIWGGGGSGIRSAFAGGSFALVFGAALPCAGIGQHARG